MCELRQMAFTSPLKSLFFLSTRGISLFFFLNKTIRNNKKRGDKLLMRKTARTPCVCVCVAMFFFSGRNESEIIFSFTKRNKHFFLWLFFFFIFYELEKVFFSFYLLFSPPMASQCFRTSIKRREEEEEEDKVYVSPCCVDSKSLASHAAER